MSNAITTVSFDTPCLPGDAYDILFARAETIAQNLSARSDKILPHFFPTRDQQFDDIAALAAPIIENFTDVVILGVGGSSLGANAIDALLHKRFRSNVTFPRLHFLDNLGPHSLDHVIRSIDFGSAHFMAISKSGETTETVAQFMACLSAAKSQLTQQSLAKHFTVITEAGESPLRALARHDGIPIVDHPKGLGGRYSVFSIVGLLPTAIAGLDVKKLIAGATSCFEEDALLEPARGAASMCHLMQQGKISQHICMPYDSRLDEFARWQQQLMAESLGKGGYGLSPIRAVGPVDQHSQLQLYLDGPDDKYFTIITENTLGFGTPLDVPAHAPQSLSYLHGHKIGDIVHTEARATIETIRLAKRPLRHIALNILDEYSLGRLMMHFMLETIIMADLLGVNAFDQPAVESGKELTRKYLNERNLQRDTQ